MESAPFRGILSKFALSIVLHIRALDKAVPSGYTTEENIPREGDSMTSASLQLIALCTMLVDHVGLSLFPGVFWLRWIGRLSFPLFLFLLAEGFVHTSSRRKYALRLGLFAVISEAPYQFLISTVYGGGWQLPCQNVFFELLMAFFAMWCVERGGVWLLGAGGAVLVAECLGMDYGGYGVLLAICFLPVGSGPFPGSLYRIVLCGPWELGPGMGAVGGHPYGVLQRAARKTSAQIYPVCVLSCSFGPAGHLVLFSIKQDLRKLVGHPAF